MLQNTHPIGNRIEVLEAAWYAKKTKAPFVSWRTDLQRLVSGCSNFSPTLHHVHPKKKYKCCWKNQLWTHGPCIGGGNSKILHKLLEPMIEQGYRQIFREIGLLVRKLNTSEDYQKYLKINVSLCNNCWLFSVTVTGSVYVARKKDFVLSYQKMFSW